MTFSTASDHVAPYPIVPSAPCCGRPVTDREPMPPGWMLLDGKPFAGLGGGLREYEDALDDSERSGALTITNQQDIPSSALAPLERGLSGMVIETREVMNPTLRGLKGTRRRWGPRPGARLGKLGACACGPGPCGCGPRCGAGAPCGCARPLSGLGDITTAVLNEATEAARTWAAEAGITISLPPSPVDVIAAVYRLAETERELEVLRQKLRRLRAEGLLRPADAAAYTSASKIWYSAAKAMYTPVIEIIATTVCAGGPAFARRCWVNSLLPTITMPPGLDAPDRPFPWVPSMGDLERIRRGDMTGGDTNFREAVDYVRSRMSGGGTRGLRGGLGILGIDDLTIGGLICITIGVVAVAAVVIALAIPAYALTQVLAAWVATRAAADVATRRKEVYDACLARGTSSAECTRAAQSLVPMPVIPPAPGIGLELGVGGLVVGALVIGGAWYAFGGGKDRLKAAGRAAFSGYTPAYGPLPVRKPKKLRWR